MDNYTIANTMVKVFHTSDNYSMVDSMAVICCTIDNYIIAKSMTIIYPNMDYYTIIIFTNLEILRIVKYFTMMITIMA